MSLEQLRSTHEELEVYHEVLLHELSRHPRSKRQIVFQDHKLNDVSRSAHKRARLLVDLHEDKHKLLASECKEFQDQIQRFPKFYQELQDINKFHLANADLVKQQPNHGIVASSSMATTTTTRTTGEQDDNDEQRLAVFSELDIPESGASLVNFSGEEYFGRFLDLHTFFGRYKNLPGANIHLGYESYVEKNFYDFSNFPPETKSQRRYFKYTHDLLEYVEGFIRRTRPLSKYDAWRLQQVSKFDTAWSTGTVPGWSNGKADAVVVAIKKQEKSSSAKGTVSLKGYANAFDMQALGLEVLKAELSHRGVKCGGTLADRAERLFQVRDLKKNEIPKDLRAKKQRAKRPRGGSKGSNKNGHATNGASSSGTSSASDALSFDKRVALGEWLLLRCATTTLKLEVQETLRHLERKRTRTYAEMQREMMDELKRDDEEGADGKAAQNTMDNNDSDDEDNEMLYNPKGLPLGWDGKPIPYWLYRLHGLSKSFKCEICGNHTYWGHKEFDQHFQEPRHMHGMKCLQVPNTNHFHGITGISDALSLYTKLKMELQSTLWNGADHEEFEDSAGNVMNKASYEDLKKQGLL